jgi:hypothetical protein
MSEPWGTIFFSSGEKINVVGTMSDIQGQLNSAGGAAVLFEDRNQHEVLVNPAQVTHVVVLRPERH